MKRKKRFRTFEEYHLEKLRDPEDALDYLIVVLDEFARDHDIESLMFSLQMITIAQGGVGFLAKKAGINRESLYKILSGKRSPKWKTMEALFKGLGYKVTLTRIQQDTH